MTLRWKIICLCFSIFCLGLVIFYFCSLYLNDIAAVLISALFFLVFSILYSKKIIRPFEEFHKEIFNRAENDWTRKIDVSYPSRELTAMAQAFNRVITQLAQREETLVNARERYQLVLKGTNDGIWEIDLNNGGVHLSNRWKEMLGYLPRELEDSFETFTSLIHPDDVGRVIQNIDDYILGITEKFELEYRLVHKEGHILYVLSRGFAANRNALGGYGRFVGTNMDITQRLDSERELKELNETLEQKVLQRTEALEKALVKAQEADEAKSMFLATISHEIRTPMNGIIGLSRMLSQAHLPTELHHHASTLHHSALGLMTILNDILDMSRVESGKIQLEEIPFNLEHELQELIDLFSPLAKNKNITISLEIAAGTPTHYLGDPVRLRQILSNLINNALKFTSEGGCSLYVHRLPPSPTDDACEIEFIIHDTGIGIAEEKLKDLFNSFTQADSSINRRYGGTGLGLSIAKGLTEIMGGEISVSSKMGHGTDFTVNLPLSIDEKEDSLSTSTATQDTETINKQATTKKFLTNQKILIADDNFINRMILKDILEHHHAKADEVESGHQALAAVKETPYDLIFMDIRMPDLSGTETRAQIKQQENLCQNTPIIALTADAGDKARNHYLGLGFDGYLSKPFLPEDILHLLEDFYQIEPRS